MAEKWKDNIITNRWRIKLKFFLKSSLLLLNEFIAFARPWYQYNVVNIEETHSTITSMWTKVKSFRFAAIQILKRDKKNFSKIYTWVKVYHRSPQFSIAILNLILIAWSSDPYFANIIWYSIWLQIEHRIRF